MYDYIFHAPAPIWDRRKEEKPLGGTYLTFINVTRELARRGCHVVCYTDCQGRYDTSSSGLEYKYIGEYNYNVKSKYFVSLRHFGHDWEKIPSEKKILWSQDNIVPDDAQEKFDSGLELLVCVSDFHKGLLQPGLQIDADRIKVIYNSLDFDIYPSIEEICSQKRGNKGVYLSCPDRGLDNLLDVFTIIRDIGCDFQLYVFSSWLPYAYFDEKESDKRMERFILPLQGTNNLFWHKGYGQLELIQQLTSKDIFVYPTEFVEAGCYAFIQSCACGVIPLMTNTGVFPEWQEKSNYAFELIDIKSDWKETFAVKVCNILLSGDRKNYEEIRLFAEEYFDIKKNIEGWLEL